MSSSNGISGSGRIWTVVCAVATVVLGPAAVTASALDQANKAPLYHAVTDQPPNRSHSLG